MKQILAGYSNDQLLAGMLRTALTLVYLFLLAASIWLCRDFSFSYMIDRIVPYGIPPLLTLLSASFLSLFVLTLEQTRTETLLFSIISLAFAGLNLDIFLLGIIKDPHIALIVSRIDHFMLVLVQLGANLHLAYLVCGKKDRWWIVYLAYGIGAVMALFTPTNLYFKGVYTYYWGFFAQKAILYDVMSTLWLAGTIYAVIILSSAYRTTDDPRKKDTIKFILLGFVCSAALSLTNTPAIYGHEIFPLGTFTFISLFLLAYGLFKYNLWLALQQLRTVIFTIGQLAIMTVIAFIPSILFPDASYHLKLITGLVLVAGLNQPVSKLWDRCLGMVLKKTAALLQKEVYNLTYRLSEIHHLNEIHREISSWLFKFFSNSRCAMVFADTEKGGFSGWQTMNPESFSGFFSKTPAADSEDTPIHIPAEHPLIKKIASTRHRLIPHAMVGRWMDEQRLPDNPDDRLQQAGMIIPIFLRHRLLGLIIIGNKLNDRSYSNAEKEILKTIGAVLGPFIENANLLEDLEQKVQTRTRDLYKALNTLKQKNKKISENHAIIKQQNHIFLSLFETATRIHEMDELHELFADTLNQLRSLFPQLGFGIIHEGDRAEILESGAFIGIPEKEQTIILENRQYLTRQNINRILSEKLSDPDETNSTPMSRWTLQQMQVRDNRNLGKIIIKGPLIDPFTHRVISIFLAQVSAAAHNKYLMNKLEITANTDGLTGVANRSFFDRAMKKTLHNAALFPQIYFSIVMIDINGLKRVNDTFGHDQGDEMILRVAKVLMSVCRETDTLARMGGDEFIILMPATASTQAKVAVERIRSKEKTLFLSCPGKNNREETLPIRFSIGFAGSDETPPEKVIKLADQRMYSDKETFYQNIIATSRA